MTRAPAPTPAPAPAVVVLAKHPEPGRVKTRLCPPCTPAQAAAVARASLLDTLDACAGVAASRRILALDGTDRTWRGRGFEVIPQRGDGLGERIGAALTDCRGPALLVGMDTPQATTADIAGAGRALMATGVDAVLGPTLDGGYWIVGMRRPRLDAFRLVPMSAPDTCERQWDRFAALGLRVAIVGGQRDIDEWDDALAVAAKAPESRTAREVRTVAASFSAAP